MATLPIEAARQSKAGAIGQTGRLQNVRGHDRRAQRSLGLMKPILIGPDDTAANDGLQRCHFSIRPLRAAIALKPPQQRLHAFELLEGELAMPSSSKYPGQRLCAGGRQRELFPGL